MITNIEHIDITSTKGKDIFDEKFLNKPGKAIQSVKNITLSVGKDVEVFINDSKKPLLIKSAFGLSITDANIKTIKPNENGVSIYAIFSY